MGAKKPEHAGKIDTMLADVRAAGLKLTPQRMAIGESSSRPTRRIRPPRTLRAAPAEPAHDVLCHGLQHLGRPVVGGPLRGSCALAGVRRRLRFRTWIPIITSSADVCGAVRDVPSAAPGVAGSPDASSAKAVAHVAPGFELRSIERIFRGICASCARGAPEPERKQENRVKSS